MNKKKLLLLTTLLAATAGAFVIGSGLQVAVFADGFAVEATPQGAAGPHAVVQVGGEGMFMAGPGHGRAALPLATRLSAHRPKHDFVIGKSRVWRSQLETRV